MDGQCSKLTYFPLDCGKYLLAVYNASTAPKQSAKNQAKHNTWVILTVKIRDENGDELVGKR